MFVVIQEVQTRREQKCRTYERIEVTEYTINGIRIFSHVRGGKMFKRPIKKAYKISVHHSYRENGKLNKKQWGIITISYYDLIEYGLSLFYPTQWKLDEMGITEDDLYGMIYEKLNPIIERITEEFQQTEEYKVQQEQKNIEMVHLSQEKVFDMMYGSGQYKRCYDVFGTLRNEEYLEKLKADKKANEEYQKRSKKFEEDFFKNFNQGSNNRSYSNNVSSNYTETDKPLLKKFYKVLAREFHPDTKNGSEEAMKLINRLKEQWS